MRPDSSGSRSTSSTLRSNSGSSSRNSTPCMAIEISPGRGSLPPPTSATAGGGVVRRAERPLLPVARRRSRALPSDCIAADASASSCVIGGRMPGRRDGEHRLARARRPDHDQAVPAGCRDLERALRVRLSLHVLHVGVDGCRSLRRRASRARERLVAGEVRADLQQGARGIDRAPPSTSAASARVLAPAARRRAARAAAPSAIASAPRIGRSSPVSASSPANSNAVEPLGGQLPRRGEDAERDRQVEAARFLGQVRGREIDGDAARRKLEARVLQAPRARGPWPPSPRLRAARRW